jgi:DNA repair exonuclease SbcCD nuclease subunit
MLSGLFCLKGKMKVLFTADVHIKLGQKNVPIPWAKNRFNMLWSQLRTMQKDCDLFVIGGDVFDKLPNMEELETYFDLVTHCDIPTIIYAGNHEAVKKDTTFLSNLKQVTNRLNSNVEIIDDYCKIENMDFIPYNKLKDFEKNPFQIRGNICFTHVRGEIPPHVKPEVDLEIFASYDRVLAGDLHSYENSQKNIIYPGSPVTTSFHRHNVDTGVVVLDTLSLEHEWRKLELPQLLRKTVGVHDPKPPTDYDHTIYQVEGDMQELGELEDSDLIDRKVIKRDTDSALILDSEMSMSEEVREYLTYILELPPDTIERVLKEFQNYADKIESE